jgi:hypothetical protein
MLHAYDCKSCNASPHNIQPTLQKTYAFFSQHLANFAELKSMMIQYNVVVDKLLESESDLSEVKHARYARIAAKNTTRWTGHSNAVYAITASWGAGQEMAKKDKYKNSVINDENEGFTDFNHGLHAFLKDHYCMYWDKMVKRMQTTKKSISHEFSKLVRDWITAIDSYTKVNLFSTS